MIICACLLSTTEDHILLVRAHGKRVWYLPGGKINPGEQPVYALCRELFEELGVEIKPKDCFYLKTIVGPSHNLRDKVQLICFAATLPPQMQAKAEIADIAWIPKKFLHVMAPAVRLLVTNHNS